VGSLSYSRERSRNRELPADAVAPVVSVQIVRRARPPKGRAFFLAASNGFGGIIEMLPAWEITGKMGLFGNFTFVVLSLLAEGSVPGIPTAGRICGYV